MKAKPAKKTKAATTIHSTEDTQGVIGAQGEIRTALATIDRAAALIATKHSKASDLHRAEIEAHIQTSDELGAELAESKETHRDMLARVISERDAEKRDLERDRDTWKAKAQEAQSKLNRSLQALA